MTAVVAHGGRTDVTLPNQPGATINDSRLASKVKVTLRFPPDQVRQMCGAAGRGKGKEKDCNQ